MIGRRGFITGLVSLLMVWSVQAQDMRGNGMSIGPLICPADRPIRKTVDVGIVSCTLLACMGKLVCPPNLPAGEPECFRMPASDCNTCARGVSEICLSQEELEKAR